MRICCIDPGITNFAISVEEFDEKRIPTFTGKRYGKKRLATPDFELFLYEHVYGNGRLVFFAKENISPDKGAFNSDMITTRIKLTEFLQSIRNVLDTCDAFFCERQLKRNPYAQQVEFHCYSYFSWIYGNTRVISDVSASEKYFYLGCEKNLPKNVRKKWAVDVCLDILRKRGDEENIHSLKRNKKKLDDIADTVIICQALKVKIFTKG